MSFLDFIFPKYCVSCKSFGAYICASCFTKLSFSTRFLCLICGKTSIDGLTHPKCVSLLAPNGAFSSLEYKGLAKKLLYQFKYKPYLTDLHKVLGELLYEGIIQHEALMRELENAQLLCTAVPLYTAKRSKRGYNQAELLAKSLTKQMGIPYVKLLVRVKDTKSQFNLSKLERKENMANAFKLVGEQTIKRETILLVDDVLTTGSTLLEASKILKKAGAQKVFGVTLAKD